MPKHSNKSSFHLTDKHIVENEGDKLDIVIIGAGATGSHLVYNLAAMYAVNHSLGRRLLHVKVYDHDLIEEHNIGKQGYFDPDVYKNKATAIVSRVNRAYGLDWEAIPEKFVEEPGRRISEIIISCVDKWSVRQKLWKFLQENPSCYRYWMDIGNGKNDGQIILHSCKDDRLLSVIDHAKGSKISREDEAVSCSMIESLTKQGLYINKTMATLAANMLHQLILGQIDYRGVVVNLERMMMLPIKL